MTERNTYGITLKTTLLTEGARDKDGWEHDLWRVELVRNDVVTEKMIVPEYRAGVGHRRTKNGCSLQQLGRYRMLRTPKGKVCTHSLCEHQGVKPVAPTLYDIVTSLKADLTHGEVFEEWALGLGYDTDSRSALNIYLACQEEERQFRRLMGDQFQAIVEDEEYE